MKCWDRLKRALAKFRRSKNCETNANKICTRRQNVRENSRIPSCLLFEAELEMTYRTFSKYFKLHLQGHAAF